MLPYAVFVSHPIGNLDPEIDLSSLNSRQRERIYSISAHIISPLLEDLEGALGSVGITSYIKGVIVEDVENPIVSVVAFLDGDGMAMNVLEFLNGAFCDHCRITVRPLSKRGLADFSEVQIR